MSPLSFTYFLEWPLNNQLKIKMQKNPSIPCIIRFTRHYWIHWLHATSKMQIYLNMLFLESKFYFCNLASYEFPPFFYTLNINIINKQFEKSPNLINQKYCLHYSYRVKPIYNSLIECKSILSTIYQLFHEVLDF